MADSEVLKKLRDIPYKIQTTSLKQRREVLNEIRDVLATPGLTDPAVRFICRALTITLDRYRDTTSQSYVKELLIYLTTTHRECTLKTLLPILMEISEQLRHLATSKSTCRNGIYGIRWSTVLVESAFKTPELEVVDFKSLVLSQANLLAVVTAYGDKKKNAKAYSMLHTSWNIIGTQNLSKWMEILIAQPPDSGPQICVTFSALCKHLKEIGDEGHIAKHKAKMLESFIKSLISVKSRPNVNYISGCSSLLGLVTEAEVQDTLLPALHKSMLRSPETIIQAVGEVLHNLQINLDGIAVEIGKCLIGNLHSKESGVGEEAAAALCLLAVRCCSLQAVSALMAHAFALYHGTGPGQAGKRPSSDDKIAVLNGIGALSSASLSADARAALFADLAAQMARVVEAESHERTLCVALDNLQRYLPLLDNPLPDKIIDIIKKNLSAKSTTQVVRTAYTSVAACAARSGALSATHAATLRPLLAKAAEKAQQQPLQHPVVCEGISATLALVLLDEKQAQAGAGGGGVGVGVWACLTHPDKNTLLHDRTLAAASDDVLIQVAVLCRSTLENYPGAACPRDAPVYRAFVLALLSTAKSVRVEATKEVRALLAAADRAPLAINLIANLNQVLEEGKIFVNKDKSPEEGAPVVTGKMILDCIAAICSYRDYSVEDGQLLALESLRCCHHPVCVAENRRAWVRLVAHLRLQPRQLVAQYAATLRHEYIAGFRPNPTVSNVVVTLLSANPDSMAGSAVQSILEALQDGEVLAVTRDEYFTYLTPEGELYDKSSVPGNENNKEMNMKRESKAYSYKEQQEELQLRRELEDKRRQEGKLVEVPLTAKQKEAMKAQLAKEEEIRKRLSVVNSRVEAAVGLTASVREGSPRALREHARRLVPALMAALRSPMAAPRLAPAHRDNASCLLPGRPVLADTVARVSIRLHDPACDLDASWEEELLEKATARAINLVYAATSPAPLAAPLTGPALCYIFPLLKKGLSVGLVDETTMINGLTVIGAHARSHTSQPPAADADAELERPELSPIDDIFRLLVDLISSTKGRTQTACTAALLDTAELAARGAVSQTDVSCLLAGLQNPLDVVRDAALRALLCVSEALGPLFQEPEYALTLTKRLLVATFDIAEDNKKLGEKLWEQVPLAEACQSQQSAALMEALLGEVQHPAEQVQRAAALALAHLVQRAAAADPGVAEAVLQRLQDVYHERLPMIPARVDLLGHVLSEEMDEWGGRRGVGLALRALAPLLSAAAVSQAVRFFVQHGLPDRAEPVQAEMLNAAMAVVEIHGKETISSQLPVFEEFLDKAPKTRNYDCVRQSVVLLVGGLARHLQPQDARIKPITLRLVSALATPSQQVQEAVSNCLPHLVTSPALDGEIPNIVNKLMKQLLTAEKYGERKGAAYGIAGIIKGLGILSLKQLDVMGKLTEAVQEKKNFKNREGALFGFEMLCHKLGRLFEPYIVHVLPHLLLCFGDTSQYVRTAADDTAKLIMSKLSAHGVKLVLPALLNALADDNWRTKAGSIELLGSMAYCAPKQLSSCLPSIVPRLIDTLSDSHLKVQEAGAEALSVIGSVIRNPEIQAIVPVLLEALQDPSNKTSVCLQTLLDTKFVHFIDAPSLALIMPVVQRAFLDRSTETRKMAAQIIGNMYSLTDQKDLTPYLPNIMPGLKSSLLDPVPDVRSVSARALGAMVKGLGESSFEELLPWLMTQLTSETSSVDRSGAAQGLSEVVAGLGVTKLHKIMPDIISTADRSDIAPHVKDGYIMMFIYMPGCFPEEFRDYIAQIINPILKALADENEYVRETALRAGQRMVNLYADSSIALLLPELEKGLFDDNWRIRFSSVQLLGDLLYRISGVSGKMSTETASEDDNFGTEQSHKAILGSLGVERRNRVLAGLYMGRSDVALMVRQAALHVWKVVVTNTPKTLREILPTLFGLLLGCLASTSYDKRQVAARTLGDLVRKLGERVLPEIVPILERGLMSERADQRQGVCIGLSEILASTSREAVTSFADGLVPTVRTALCDSLPEVRLAAARTFDSLHATIGNKALDDILPHMLGLLADPDPDIAEAALDGLKQIMAIKSRAVLPYLIPVLTGTSAGGGRGVDTRALSALAAAAGGALGRHLPRVLPALLAALAAARHEPHHAKELEHCRDALLPVVDPPGVRCIIDYLLDTIRTGGGGTAGSAPAAAALLCAFVSHTRADLSPHVPQLLRGLLALLADKERDVLLMAWEALLVFTKALEPEQLIGHVSDVRAALRLIAADLDGDLLPGFCLPKGIAPVLPLFRESILNGLPEDKENAALMLGELIKLTPAQSLQPSVIHVTGPLIRILGDRFNASVKAAVLDTLASLLAKVGIMLKQFLPQLQTTFLKALQDPSRAVRLRAGQALAQLVHIHTRTDPLFLDVHNGIKSAEDQGIRETSVQALRYVVTVGGDKMSAQQALAILATLSSSALLAHPDDSLRSAVGGALGALLKCLPPPHQDAAIQHHVLGAAAGGGDDWLLQHGRTCALFVALKESPEVVYKENFEDKVEKTLAGYLASDKILIVCNGVRGMGYLIRHLLASGRPVPPNLLSLFVRTMNHSSNEVKQLMARASVVLGKEMSSATTGPAADVLRALLPALVNGTKEKNTYVRANSELALRAVLRLHADNNHAQACGELLEVGAREALNDVVARVLRRAPEPQSAREEDLDCTLLT